MSKLRQSARGQECHLRIPRVCCHDNETTVLAHIRKAGIAGTGMKPPDVCGVFACRTCHDYIDGRGESWDDQLTKNTYILDGHLRTLKWWVDHGFL